MAEKIAIIGTGISGLSAAWHLDNSHDIVLFEKNNYVGGHSHTVDIQFNGQKTSVDTGFIVFNHKNYPHLSSFFKDLKIETYATEMSFSVYDQKNHFQYASHFPKGVLAQPLNVFKFKFLKFIQEIIKFNNLSCTWIKHNENSSWTLADFLNDCQFSQFFQDYYISPLGSSIWSTSKDHIMDFPAYHFLDFLNNHGLLTLNKHPQWYSLQGGSRQYINKLLKKLKCTVKLEKKILKVNRFKDYIEIVTESGERIIFDQVIIATHADQALSLLAQPTITEQTYLEKFSYTQNKVYLHRDISFMPTKASAWASWNYQYPFSNQTLPCVTYWMNRLQNLNFNSPVFVTLNPEIPPQTNLIYDCFDYQHPCFTLETKKSQRDLTSLQGQQRTWFCGSYFGSGFHEDAFYSGLKVAQKLKEIAS